MILYLFPIHRRVYIFAVRLIQCYTCNNSASLHSHPGVTIGESESVRSHKIERDVR